MKTTILEGCAITISPCPVPTQEGMEEGRQIMITVLDPQGVPVENVCYPMDMKLAKNIGGQLLGIGGVQVANGTDVSKLVGGQG